VNYVPCCGQYILASAQKSSRDFPWCIHKIVENDRFNKRAIKNKKIKQLWAVAKGPLK